MRTISTTRFILNRLASDWLLLSAVLIGILVSMTIAVATPMYFRALERLALNIEFDSLEGPRSDLTIIKTNLQLNKDTLQVMDQLISNAADQHLSDIFESTDRYLTSPPYLAVRPTQTVPLVDSASEGSTSRAYLRQVTNLENHLNFQAGRIANEEVKDGPNGLEIEAVVSLATASFFKLQVGDVVTIAPSLETARKISVRIVGVAEVIDSPGSRWFPNASMFLNPLPLMPSSSIDTTPVYEQTEPPIPLFITEKTLIDMVTVTYPDTLVNIVWFVVIENQSLKNLDAPKILHQLASFEKEISSSIPRIEILTGIDDVLLQFEQRRFFTRVPLLILSIILIATVLYFLLMVVSHLSQIRTEDTARMKARGANTLQVIRFYFMEGLIMVLIGMILSPILATSLVYLATTSLNLNLAVTGTIFPIKIEPIYFLASTSVGVICLAIYLIPTLLGSPPELLAKTLRFSRPPLTSFFHQYYIDVAFLILGSLVFWELHTRKHIISGGLFGPLELNEMLLISPFLFLISISLLFLRFFPLIVRFLAGESQAFLHFVAVASISVLCVAAVVDGITTRKDDLGLLPTTLAIGYGFFYWWTTRNHRFKMRLCGLGFQMALLIGYFLTISHAVGKDILLTPTIGMLSLVPGQILFTLLRFSRRATPSWLIICLWRLTRNPLQYAQPILLLVLTVGLGVVSTTVSASLGKNRQEHIQYAIASDLRVSNIPREFPGIISFLEKEYLKIPGVTSVSVALRENANVGPASVQLLSLESNKFSDMSWYRKDFSDDSLLDLMRMLGSHPKTQRIEVPENAVKIGLWAKSEKPFTNLSARIVLEDGNGKMINLTPVKINNDGWQLISTKLPSDLTSPLFLTAIQFLEPVLGDAGTPGSVFVDDIHVTTNLDPTNRILENFESFINWTPILTTPNSLDKIVLTKSEVHGGQRSGIFSFGKNTIGGIRGFQISPTGGPIPVVISTQFAKQFNSNVGDIYIAEIANRLVPVVVRGMVRYFPTIDPKRELFVITDLENLLQNLNLLTFGNTPRSSISVEGNELFLSGTPEAMESLTRKIHALTPDTAKIQDKGSEIGSAQLDPLTTSGWIYLSLLSLGVMVVVSAIGYSIFLICSLDRVKSEVGSLRTIGLSRSQLMGLLWIEHSAVIVLGISIGIWAGLQVSKLVISSTVVADTAMPLVPPVLLTTHWGLLAPAYLLLICTLISALLILNGSLQNLNLNTTNKTGSL